MIKRLNNIPAGFLNASAEDLHKIIPDSTLISLEGEKKEPLFLSVLLHGNEPTGLVVAQNILKKYQASGLPRAILLFIGNVKAAGKGLRRLDNQPDYNRIWLEGKLDKETAIHHDIALLLHEMARRTLFASIDIHNNTGINPHYGCVNKLDPEFLNLAKMFSRTLIYFIQPGGVQSKAFSHLCPSVTLECGKVGDEFGIQLATHFVDEVLNLDNIPKNIVTDQDIDLFHTLAVIKIPEAVSISFDGSAADIQFIQGIESLNFEEIPPDTSIATIRAGISAPILVLNEDGDDITEQLFFIKENRLVNRKTLMPAMLTLEENIIRQDCLCYVMERYQIAMGEKASDDEKPVWTV